MKKTLIPILACLALCAGAAGTLVVTGAFAQTASDDAHKPALTKPMGPHHHSPEEMAARMKSMCADHYARAVGVLAYVEAKLQLTPAQQPLFARWKDVKLGAASARRDKCETRTADASKGKWRDGKHPSVVDRMAREEDMLKHRLAQLQAEQPALEALFNSLTPEQKMALGDLGHHHGMDGMRGHGMMGHRMMAGGWGDHGAPGGMMPPPPPAQ
jgi:hypothetical protein